MKRAKTRARTKTPKREDRLFQVLEIMNDEISNMSNRIHALDARIGAEEAAEYRWVMADGDEILPKDMDTDHLRNSITYCVRRLLHERLSLGTTLYVVDMKRWIDSLHYLLIEAERRGLKI